MYFHFKSTFWKFSEIVRGTVPNFWSNADKRIFMMVKSRVEAQWSSG